MLYGTWILLILLLDVSVASQTPFSADHIPSHWNLDARPHANATGHLIFATVSSLMQHWPNTRYRNGHTIVPATIPRGTLLYHGRANSSLPTSPEWTSVDPEHSITFCGAFAGDADQCWHLTLVTSRPLRVLYFDGSSAAKMKDGPMDTQDLISWGKVIPERFFHEDERLNALCAWGRRFQLDGFVRMEMDFEVMLCDFSQGVDVLSFDRLVPPDREGQLRSESQDSGAPTSQSIFPHDIDVLSTGSWSDHYPGDQRIHVDYTRIVSLYDISLTPSLVGARSGKTRLQHRLLGISDEDISAVLSRLASVLYHRQNVTTNSGIDWETVIRVVINRHAGRLETVKFLLNATAEDMQSGDATSLLLRANSAHLQLQQALQPYLLQSAKDEAGTEGRGGKHDWASPIYEACSTSHTKFISHRRHELSGSETLLLSAVEQTTTELCRVMTRMWAAGVNVGLGRDVKHTTPLGYQDAKDLVIDWGKQLDGIMEWLDWSIWLKCKPACSFEELCYLPTWPYFYSKRPTWPPKKRKDRGFRWDVSILSEQERREYEDPQPRCIKRFDRFDHLGGAV